ncbi:PREDICTED: zinc finger CCCH domain-containing protein 44-like isoform X3 [Camelina sativa]|uniref:Zinc finger CCCH domain-containing protein 44-like isoform X3 n=1 Tax=Camelina sativa TaxID=90675 RepID=A0ABM0ZGR2_CAMSA|nr:PREDICTED: zinc finger CCCH domain-containing protein 44-like isoform X3 [Camelina sativa]
MENQQKQLQRGVPELASLAGREESSVRGIDLMRVDQCDEIGAANQVSTLSVSASTVSGTVAVPVSTEQEVKVIDEAAPVKRKRGRPPRSQANTPLHNRPPPPPPPPVRKDDKEEDVCFICFDGGDLVLCDRRNCPKAYHPACIKRDEAFFRTTAKWNCGWHICGTCQKASSYMCYTCTFSVCKRCIKDADYVIVRGNMGLCGTCIKPVMLIENIAQGDNEAVKVDFDDKLSWEYLFKVYWLCLKEDLSLTVDELTRANNPWKEVSNTAPIVESRNDPTNNRVLDVAVNGTKRRRTSDSPTLPSKVDGKKPNNILKKAPGDTCWATKELLEFVSFMKNGDTSVLSQFDVQGLVLDYIKKKDLRDPLQKSQVVCDPMLRKLFGKPRVGHFEMLKLLESHVLIQENQKYDKTTNGESTHTAPSQIEDRRRKMRRKTDGRVQNENLDAHAAIDVHNINLIYLRRKYLESLLDDINKVHEKVVGTILRIKVSGSDQKLDIHRLVQVVGTSKATTSYQLGPKTTDVMLEILNLDKREVISIDQLSDQNVTEDECKRLRQSIKNGLNKRLTVGDILKTAATLQAMRISESLEAETLKLNHLRDRASEKGHRKELRECVEKLELLKSPEERQRRLQEVPEVHTDPSMDPSHASSEYAGLGTRNQDNHITAQSEGPLKKGAILNNMGNNAQKKYDAPILRSRNSVHSEKDDCSKVHNNSSNIQETGKDDEESEIWHYRDPTGKTQGPFSMVQLRRWKSSGHFPPYLRIWKAHENQDESVLLTDALAGRFDKASTLPSSSSLPQEPKPSPHDSGMDVNCLQKNHTPVNTSATSSPYTVSAHFDDPKEKQVVALVACSGEDGNSVCPQPQVSCPASMSVVTGHVVTPDVRETPGSDLFNVVRADGNHSTTNTVEDGSNGGSVYINGSVHAPNLNQESHFPDFPSPTPKSSPEDLEAQAAETIQSLSSCVLVKGPSGVTWSTTTTSTTDSATTTSSVVVTGGLLPQVTQQNAVVLAAPSVKPIDLVADHATTTQTSDNTQVAQSSGWPAIVADPDECDESVSDLLAEVEAMEQNGLPSSPTSTFHCDDDDDLTKGPEKDFFNPVARMSLAPETCRMDVSQASILENVSAGKSSMGTEEKVNTPFSHCGTAGPELLLFAPPAPAPASITHDLTLTTTALRLGSETTVEAGPVVERLLKSGSELSPRALSYHDSARGNTERSPRGSQQKRSSGHSRDRQWLNNGHNSHNNRQWPYSNSHGYAHGSGSYAAHPPKGLKICKFYESGNCKKGASCSFWHP